MPANLLTLSLEQRIHVLKSGLHEGRDEVRAAVHPLVDKWWRVDCGGDTLEMLRLLDVPKFQSECLKPLASASCIHPYCDQHSATLKECTRPEFSNSESQQIAGLSILDLNPLYERRHHFPSPQNSSDHL